MLKQYNWFIILTLIICSLYISCDNGPESNSDKNVVKIGGYQYIHHIQNNGATPQPAEYAYYTHSMTADDSILTDSRDINLTSLMKMPPAQPEGSKPRSGAPILNGLQSMSIGDSLTIKIPIDSIKQIPDGFTDYNYLNYNIVLVDIKTEEAYNIENNRKAEKAAALKQIDLDREEDIAEFLKKVIDEYKSGNLDEQIIETTSGLKYFIHENGNERTPKAGNPIKVHYYGMLPDGTPFDNSFKRGEPYFFTLGTGQVIPGWDEGIELLNIGSKATLFVSPELAYGPGGSPPTIPANTELIFYVETFYPYD